MSELPLDLPLDEFEALRASGRAHVLVDCREPWEFELVRLPDAVLIPLGQLEARADEVPAAGEVVVYCHHGVRSRAGAAALRRAGIPHARSLRGGIDAVSQVLDPSLPRY